MSIINNDLLLGSGDEGYNLTRSLRFRSSASARLVRTFGTPTNQNKWTLSVWVKTSTIVSNTPTIIGADTSASTALDFTTNSTLEFGWSGGQLITTQVFRDPSAWYHIIVAADTTNATASNRLKIYVNGAEVTAFGTDNRSSLGSGSLKINSAVETHIGTNPAASRYYDGYMAEMYFVDGQALTPSSFGETDTITGVWKPKRYAGTYGTNGFYLPFTDNSALTTSSNVGLGKDFSGNANYWTTNNISITSGVTYDSMTDVPTLTSATAANFAVLNPVNTTTQLTFSNANLATTYASGTWNLSRATIGVSSGSWYWEVTAGGANNSFIGIANSAAGVYDALGVNSNSAGWNFGGSFFYNGTSVNFAVVWTTGDVIGVAFNATTNVITFYKNGVVVNSGGTATAVTGGLYFPANSQSAGTFNVNFGQRPFAFSPPTGFVALNTFNLPTSTIVKGDTAMNIALASGASIKTTTEALFSGQFLEWIKDRANANNHQLLDGVRGLSAVLQSNTTGAETTYLAPSGNSVGWAWKAGSSASTNTNGTITSTVSVNASAGFSIVTYTGTGVNATVGHGLGVAPSLIIVKQRSAGTTYWQTYHASIGNTSVIYLNDTGAAFASSVYWNNTSPTSSVFTIGTSSYANTSAATYVAYCWTPIAGYSAFGSLTGNGSSDGPMVYTGFQPKFIIIKRTDTTGNWTTFDSARDPYNQAGKLLYPNYSNAEETDATQKIDFLSNGFKIRGSNANQNASGGTYVYMAFATAPFKNSLGF